MSLVDLHVHSTASDGRLTPSRIMSEAASRGLSHVSVSDHDTVDGTPEALGAAAAAGIVAIPAVELSIDLASGGSAHLLGYFPGIGAEDLVRRDGPLGRALDRVRKARERRNPAILGKLASMGMVLNEEAVRALAGGDVVGRPHIARALLEAGHVSSLSEAFDRFLARGRPAYVERERLFEAEALDVIRGMDGIPVLAHPGLLGRTLQELSALVHAMAGRGLMGVEVFYPRHGSEVEQHLLGLSDRLGLLVTGGTDFHGLEGEQVGLGGRPGVFEIRDVQVSRFLDACAEKSAGRV
ncbi:PHP domain-containing protein [Candidatus Fermentibacteria bacterium]|nr:PHP domain-containing protein [Candidatus Fermentibacteria bacterium]